MKIDLNADRLRSAEIGVAAGAPITDGLMGDATA